MHRSLLAGFVFCLLTSLACAAQRPNILFVYVDDLGWKDPGYMGTDFYETPNIDALAKGGMFFTDAYACAANCAPSRACLQSGQYTPRHRVFNVGTRPRGKAKFRRLIQVTGTMELRHDIVTWAEALQSVGYRTGMFGKWQLHTPPGEQGYDVVVEYDKLPGFHKHLGPNGTYLADVLTDRTIDFIRENRDRPWCAYLAHFAVHAPLQPKEELVDKYQAKQPGKLHNNVAMATMIQAVDDGVGRILEELKKLNLRENTVIIFYSDNGGFGPATDMDPLWGYKGTYYEGGIRVPFCVNWPGVIKEGQKTSEPIIGVDLYPTILDIAGAKRPDQPLDGQSLLPLLKGEVKTLGERPLFWHFPTYLQSYKGVFDEQRDPLFRTRPCSVVRMGNYKLHEYYEDGGLELYDLSKDIRERHNLAAEMPEKLNEMHQVLKAWRKSIKAPVPTKVNPKYDHKAEAKAIRRMKAKKKNKK